MKRILFIIFCLILCGACTSKKSKNNRDTIRIAIGNEPDTLDPQYTNDDTSSNRIIYDLFAGLMDFDQKNQVIPGLAKSYDVSKNGLTYTFHLRHNLRFSNGMPLTARDFVFSWRRLVNPKMSTTNSHILENVQNATEILSAKLATDKLGVEAVNNSTLVVHLVNADKNFIRYAAGPTLVVLPESVVLRYGKLWTHPQHIATSGPYMLKQHIVNGYVLVEKNPWYWDSKNVAIEKVKYIPFVDINTSLDAYKSGEVDISSIPIDSTKNLESKFHKELYMEPLEGVYLLDYNMRLPVFANNIKLRQALSMAIDREALAKDILRQNQKPLYSVVTNTVEGGKYSNVGYDWSTLAPKDRIREAQDLYKASGFGPTKPLNLTISYNTNDLNKKVILAIASMWKNTLGVNVTVKNEGWNVFLNDRRNGSFMVSRDMWAPEYDIVSSYLDIYTCNSPQNYSHYCNKDYDSLLHVAKYNSNENEQNVLYNNAIKILENDYTVIPVFQYSYTKMVKPYVKNYKIEQNSFDHVQTKWLGLSK